jgi:hypothetical protein
MLKWDAFDCLLGELLKVHLGNVPSLWKVALSLADKKCLSLHSLPHTKTRNHDLHTLGSVLIAPNLPYKK